MKRILIVGATGMIGQPVARKLQQDGYQLRIFTRDIDRAQSLLGKQFEYVKGDVQQPETVFKALENCEGVHVSLKGGPAPESYDRIEHKGTATVARLAKDAGIERLTYVSGASTASENNWFYVPRAKYDAEQAIRDSGIGYTIFRASWFMETLDLFVRGKRIMKFGRQKSLLHWIAAEDFADMVSKSFSTSDAKNKTLYVYGSESRTLQEGLETYCRIVNPELKISTIPIWFMKMHGSVSRNAGLKDVTRLMAYYENISESADPSETYSLFGVPTITLEDWCNYRKNNSNHE